MASIRIVSLLSTLGIAAAVVACTSGAGDEAVQGEPQALTECDGNGTWAIKVSTPVKWKASFVLQAGEGVVTNWLRTTRVQDGLEVTDTAEVCGVETPDYQATPLFGAEKYGVRFPEATFGTLPTFELKGTLSSNAVGASFTAPPSAALLGASMTNPLTDPWPTNVAALVPVDVDGDAKPGLSADAARGPGLSNPPLTPQRTARANRVYTAFRQVLEASIGTVTSCTRVDGTAKVAVIANKPAIDSHVLGCRREDGSECAPAEYKLLDSAAPVYVPTGDAVITMIKLPAVAGRAGDASPDGSAPAAPTCADVRALDFGAARPAGDGGRTP
jgi:hypothetical protein